MTHKTSGPSANASSPSTSRATVQTDSKHYREKKRFFDTVLTIYGRNPVREALRDPAVRLFRLHLAKTNKPAKVLDEVIAIAQQQGADIQYHDRQSLSRISKNGKQDQGMAADLRCDGYQTLEQFLHSPPPSFRLLALDRITNPQNLGMIIRSACAGGMDGILLPRKGGAQIDSLVIKASAGTVFRAPIVRCESLPDALATLREQSATVCSLSSHAKTSLKTLSPHPRCVYVLGNESEGVSRAVAQQCSTSVYIPMHNGVESLNVAVTAALIAFQESL